MPSDHSLWTKDFTIITLGSVVSMLGNALSGFALSLLVLDLTGSAFLYAVYLAVYTLPQVFMPIFSGAILDRFSRKRTIYTLDFISAGLYALAAVLIWRGWFNFPVLAVGCFIIGSINSIYAVAYQSFYPLLISEGNYSKAYSISSLLETLAVVMVPVSAFVYNTVGMVPLFAIDAVSFFLAAVMETRITAEEKYIDTQRATASAGSTGRRLLDDIREGFRYLLGERGLLAVAVYFTFSALSQGASSAVTLPFFKEFFENGEYVFILVQGAAVVGRSIGSAVLYRLRLPAERKFAIALGVYLTIALIGAVYLYLPTRVMLLLLFCQGILGVTSYTIRISATQSYVPDEKKGRFNGAFNMLNTVGSFTGTLIAGALTNVLPARWVLTGFYLLEAAMAGAVIGGGRRQIAPIYNRRQ